VLTILGYDVPSNGSCRKEGAKMIQRQKYSLQEHWIVFQAFMTPLPKRKSNGFDSFSHCFGGTIGD